MDDNALDNHGRWPWPRSQLADAIETIDRMGARVIAVDILLIDPQKPEYQPDGTLLDHDGRLAAVLRDLKAKVVLAVQADDASAELSALWMTVEGQRKWGRVLDVLAKDISLDAGAVVGEVGLTGRRAARVHGKFSAIKQIVVRQAAQRLNREGRLTVDALRAELLPSKKNARLADFTELRLLQTEAALVKSIAALERRLPARAAGHEYARIRDVLPPLAIFATHVELGIVNSMQDPDGQLRRVFVRSERNGRIYPQFGIAAAAAYLGIDATDLARPTIEFEGGREPFRLASETMQLSWPRIDTERPILGLAQHVSLGRVLELLRLERNQKSRKQEHEKHTRSLVADFLSDDWKPEQLDDPALRPKILTDLKDQVEFLGGGEDDAGEDEATRAAQRWRRTENALADLERDAVQARAQLRAVLDDKLVFIGWNATGNFGDFYPTALHERTPGVVAHAVAANAVLTGYVVRTASPAMGALVTLLLGVFASVFTSRSGPRLAFLIVVLLAILFLAFNTVIVFGTWDVASATATPLLGLVTAWGGTLVMRTVKERREKAQLQRQFGARISKRLFDFLIANPETVHLEGEEREVTCFFSDLAGFTSISETLDSKTTVSLLNRYMRAMNQELMELNAYVNKFLGDGIMAVWGAMTVESPHAERACHAALACGRRLDILNGEPEFEGLPKLSMRIGVATGVVTVGDCGAPPELRDYTVIGDSANLAARLESANKQFDTRILINGRTKELIADDLLTRPLGKITVVGQKAATEIHELVAHAHDATDEQRDLVEQTSLAVEHFQAGRLEESRAAWRALVNAHGESKLADLYLGEIEAQLGRSAEEPFEGVLHLTQK